MKEVARIVIGMATGAAMIAIPVVLIALAIRVYMT